MKAVSGNDRADSLQLGLTKNKGENGNEQVHIQNTQNLIRIGRSLSDQLLEDEGGVVLSPFGIESSRQINPHLLNFCSLMKGFKDKALHLFKIRMIIQFNGNDINIGHYGYRWLGSSFQMIFFNFIVYGQSAELQDLRRLSDISLRQI